MIATLLPNGSRLSCGRLTRRRKSGGRSQCPRPGHNTPLPLERSAPASFKRLLGRRSEETPPRLAFDPFCGLPRIELPLLGLSPVGKLGLKDPFGRPFFMDMLQELLRWFIAMLGYVVQRHLRKDVNGFPTR